MSERIENWKIRDELVEKSGVKLWHNIAYLINEGMVIAEPEKKSSGYDIGDKMRVWYVNMFTLGGRAGGKPILIKSSSIEFKVDKVDEDQYQIQGEIDCGYEEVFRVGSLHHDVFLIKPGSPLDEMIQNYNGPVNDNGNTGALQKVKEALDPEQTRRCEIMERASVAHDAYQAIVSELRTQKT
jgi:hypothetical protein